MGKLRSTIKNSIESICGIDIEWVEDRSFVIAARKVTDGVWCARNARLRKLLRRLNVDLIIDVGANNGQFASAVRKSYGGDILSFEPLSSCFAHLKELSRNDPRWQIHQLALGDEASTSDINVSERSEFSSLLQTNDYLVQRMGNRAAGTKCETVNVVRLDEFLRSTVTDLSDRRIFLKMDTQGYDLHVFKGATNIVERVVLLQSEVSLIPLYKDMPSWTESVENYQRSGFRVSAMYPVCEDRGCVIEYDCLMKRAEE